MMAFADNENGEEEEDESEDEESSEEEDESLYDELSEEAVDLIRYFKDSISQLKEQTDKYTHEYEKLASKSCERITLPRLRPKREKYKPRFQITNFIRKSCVS